MTPPTPPPTRRAEPIVALDVPAADAALALVAELGPLCRFYKVGSELFTAAGPAIVRSLREAGCEVFLDLKFHDIPTTVRHGVRSAAALGARLVTVHASGGSAMLRAAVEGALEGAAGSERVCGVLAVTVLTSFTAESLGQAWGRKGVDVRAEVLRLSEIAAGAGVHGVVCSGEEAAALSARHGDRLALLVPGVRLPGGDKHDQLRVVAPAAAVAAGARYLVLGRAVTQAPDRGAAMRQVLAELGAAS